MMHKMIGAVVVLMAACSPSSSGGTDASVGDAPLGKARLPSLRRASSWVALGALAAMLLEAATAWAQTAPSAPPTPPTATAAPRELLTEQFLEFGLFAQGLALDPWEGEVDDPNGVAPPRVVRRGDLTGVLPLFGAYLRYGGHLRDWLYVFGQIHWVGSVSPPAPTRADALPPQFVSQYGVSVGAGLRWRPIARVSLRVELDVGGALATVCFLDCPAPYSGGDLLEARFRLAPRAAIDVHLSPTLALGVFGGTDLLLPSEWNGAVFLHWSPGPPDAVPPVANAR